MKMKFRLLEDLESELVDKANARENDVDVIRNALLEIGFDEKSELNGVSFDKIIDLEEDEIYCQFYVDLDSNSYKSYVSKDGDNKIMFTQTGDMQDVIEALDKFVKFMETV
jgi:hypothetical protein